MKDPYNPKDNPWFQAFDGEQIKFVTGMTSVLTADELAKHDKNLKQEIKLQVNCECQKDNQHKLLQVSSLQQSIDIEFKVADYLSMASTYEREEGITYFYEIPIVVKAGFTLFPTKSKTCFLEREGLYPCYSYITNVCFTIDFRDSLKVRAAEYGNPQQKALIVQSAPIMEYFYHLPTFTTSRANFEEMTNIIANQLQSFYLKNSPAFFKEFKIKTKLSEIHDWLRLKYH